MTCSHATNTYFPILRHMERFYQIQELLGREVNDNIFDEENKIN